jgi:hypothetical protein
MRRPSCKPLSQRAHVDGVSFLERCLADPMLFYVVIAAEADGPAIGRLEARATVGVASNVSTLDRPRQTVGHAAVMLAHPGSMSGALTVFRLARPLALKPVR